MLGKTCYTVGLLPKEFPWDYSNKELDEYQYFKEKLCDLVKNMIFNGYTTFICSGKDGSDAAFAEAVINAKIFCPHVELKIIKKARSTIEEILRCFEYNFIVVFWNLDKRNRINMIINALYGSIVDWELRPMQKYLVSAKEEGHTIKYGDYPRKI